MLLQETGWNSYQVAEKFKVNETTARMYLSGERKIPDKYIPLIPVEKFSGDTHKKRRDKDEQRINEQKKYSIKVPKFKESLFRSFTRNLHNFLYCRTEWLETFWWPRFPFLWKKGSFR